MVYCGSCPSNSGKSIIFSPASYGIQLSLHVLVDAAHEGYGVIQVHTWNQPPNDNLTGRVWYKNLSEDGGIFQITPGLDKIAVSFFQHNPNQYNFWDCCCGELNNLLSSITIRSF
jgi:hypothetical protein